MDEEWLRDRVEQGLTQKEIAELTDVSQAMISYYMRKWDIKPKYQRKEWLESHAGKTSSEIAELVDVNRKTITYWADSLDADIEFGNQVDGPHRDPEWLQEQLDSGRTQTEIAEECGVVPSAISYHASKLEE